MNYQIKHYNSIKPRNAAMGIQTSFLVCLVLIVIFVNQTRKPWLLEKFPMDISAAFALTQSNFAASVEQINDAMPPSRLAQQNLTAHHPKHILTAATSFSEKAHTELQCLALNIYFEARGESESGQRAVGHVVLNRVANYRFPKSICEVVRQGGEHKLYRCQFSWWCDGRPDTPLNKASWRHAMRISREIMQGKSFDPTGGALWYHAEYVSPYWRTAFLKGPTIGQHIFYLAQTLQS